MCVHVCVSVCVCVQGWGELRQGSGKQKSTSRGQGPPHMEAHKVTQAPRPELTPRGSPCPRVPQAPRKSTEDLVGLRVSQGTRAEPAPICSGLLFTVSEHRLVTREGCPPVGGVSAGSPSDLCARQCGVHKAGYAEKPRGASRGWLSLLSWDGLSLACSEGPRLPPHSRCKFRAQGRSE